MHFWYFSSCLFTISSTYALGNFFCNWIMFLLRWVRLIIIPWHMMRVIAQNCLEYLDAFMTSSYSPRSIVHFASFSKESDESVFPNPNLWRFHIFFSKMSWNQLLIINSFANWFHVRIWVILILPTCTSEYFCQIN